MSEDFTHFDRRGKAAMVDVGAKPVTERTATARARVVMLPATLALIRSGGAKKGDVLGVARLAGIMAAKRTADLIPLCHPLPICAVTLDLTADEAAAVEIAATVRTTGQTGVEMEALTAATVAALTVYDMCKSVDRGMRIEAVRVVHKAGGKSGEFAQDTSAPAGREVFDLAIIGGGINGTRHRPRRRRPWAVGAAGRAGRSGMRHVVGLDQADPRRAALSGALRVPPGAGVAGRARGAAARRAAHRFGRCASCCRTMRGCGRGG